MLKKTIAFEDFDGQPLVEDFYFNLSKAEIAEMELVQKDGLVKYLEKIIKEDNRDKLMELFKSLITKSVGRRSEDGRRFDKSPEITADFVGTNAYSELFVELASNAEMAAEFVKGIVPASLQQEINTQQEAGALPASTPEPEEPAWLREGRTPTADEVKNATPEQLQMAFRRKQAETTSTPTPSTSETTIPVA